MLSKKQLLVVLCRLLQVVDLEYPALFSDNGTPGSLIKVAVVEKPFPIYAYQVAAHDAAGGIRVEAGCQQFHIAIKNPLGFQIFPESADGGIGDGIEIVEAD